MMSQSQRRGAMDEFYSVILTSRNIRVFLTSL
jgi:hypothetical protein